MKEPAHVSIISQSSLKASLFLLILMWVWHRKLEHSKESSSSSSSYGCSVMTFRIFKHTESYSLHAGDPFTAEVFQCFFVTNRSRVHSRKGFQKGPEWPGEWDIWGRISGILSAAEIMPAVFCGTYWTCHAAVPSNVSGDRTAVSVPRLPTGCVHEPVKLEGGGVMWIDVSGLENVLSNLLFDVRAKEEERLKTEENSLAGWRTRPVVF